MTAVKHETPEEITAGLLAVNTMEGTRALTWVSIDGQYRYRDSDWDCTTHQPSWYLLAGGWLAPHEYQPGVVGGAPLDCTYGWGKLAPFVTYVPCDHQHDDPIHDTRDLPIFCWADGPDLVERYGWDRALYHLAGGR